MIRIYSHSQTNKWYSTPLPCLASSSALGADDWRNYFFFVRNGQKHFSLHLQIHLSLLPAQVSKLLLEHGAGGDDDEEGETYLFSEVKVRVLLARRYGYAILNIYMPTLVLMVVSYVTLFFRPAIFDTRMMSALTVQLVIATLFSQVGFHTIIL